MNGRPPTASRWRFSLRELLLLVVAVAAVLGWLRATFWFQPFRGTPLMAALDLGKEIDEARVEAGETSLAGLASGSTGGRDGQTIETSQHYRFPLAAKHFDLFAQRLAQRLKRRIEISGCQLRGSSVGSSGDDLHDAQYGYRHGETVGSARIVVLHDGEQEGRVLFYLEEHRDWP